MSLKIITVGDKTDHGGEVISGSPNHDIRGRAIARLGDKVVCPQSYPGGKPHGVNKIITAHDTLTVDGVPVAVEGCATECGVQVDRQRACDGRVKALRDNSMSVEE